MDELQEETEAEELHREYHLFMEVFRQSESEGKLPSSTSDVRSPDQASFRCEAENRSSLSHGGSKIKEMSDIPKERESGRIRPSSCPFGSTCFLEAASGGRWRLVVDYST